MVSFFPQSGKSQVKIEHLQRLAFIHVKLADVTQRGLHIGVAHVLLDGGQVHTGLVQAVGVGPTQVLG